MNSVKHFHWGYKESSTVNLLGENCARDVTDLQSLLDGRTFSCAAGRTDFFVVLRASSDLLYLVGEEWKNYDWVGADLLVLSGTQASTHVTVTAQDSEKLTLSSGLTTTTRGNLVRLEHDSYTG